MLVPKSRFGTAVADIAINFIEGRMGAPDDVTGLAAFLASEEVDYCTGSVFHLDGGWLAG